MTGSSVSILPPGCTCGHDHVTHRGEHVDMCLECPCYQFTSRCQNCGAQAALDLLGPHLVCSTACAAQLAYAERLVRERAA